MEFPAYVPVAVREYITSLIEGDEREPHGLAISLASTESQLCEIRRAIEIRTPHGESDYLVILRQQETEAIKYRQILAGDIDCLRRLIHDGRMRDAYALLTREISHDGQWLSFVHAAWAARVDFKYYRDRLKLAKELNDEIAGTAEHLEKLLRQFPKRAWMVPACFTQFANYSEQLITPNLTNITYIYGALCVSTF